jgi:hypothetical protein
MRLDIRKCFLTLNKMKYPLIKSGILEHLYITSDKKCHIEIHTSFNEVLRTFNYSLVGIKVDILPEYLKDYDLSYFVGLFVICDNNDTVIEPVIGPFVKAFYKTNFTKGDVYLYNIKNGSVNLLKETN